MANPHAKQLLDSRNNQNKKDNQTMTTPTTSNKKNKNPNHNPAANTQSADGAANTGETKKEKKAKRAKVRYVSAKDGTYFVRIYADLVTKHGAPVDPWGQPMIEKKASPFGSDPAAKEARAAAKAAEKAKYDAMSDDEKLAYTKAKKEARAATRSEKKNKEREDLIAQLKAEIAAGKI